MASAWASGAMVCWYVSVPFTRGTPLWLREALFDADRAYTFQSPSRGGHLCGLNGPSDGPQIGFQSPSRGGHLCGLRLVPRDRSGITVSVPFTRGTPLWLYRADAWTARHSVSVPFTRGTPLWPTDADGLDSAQSHVSVPFTRGTPLWPQPMTAIGRSAV